MINIKDLGKVNWSKDYKERLIQHSTINELFFKNGEFPVTEKEFKIQEYVMSEFNNEASVISKDETKDKIVRVLEFYTKTTGKKVATYKSDRGWKTNHTYIKKALKWDIKPTVEEICMIIKMKHKQWSHDSYMKKFIRLPTLFAKKNFIAYWTDLQDMKANPSTFKDFTIENNVTESIYKEKSRL